jgi:hypothetical protein
MSAPLIVCIPDYSTPVHDLHSPHTDTSVPGLSWSNMDVIPSQLLRDELMRRGEALDPQRPACGTKGNRGSYNTPLHVFALFLILILSTAGK